LFDTDNLERRVNNLIGKRNRLGKTLGPVLTVGMVGWLVAVTIGASAFSVQIPSDRRRPAVSGEPSAQANENSLRSAVRVSQITFVETTKSIDEAEIQAFAKEIEGLQNLDQSWLEEVGRRTREFWQNRGYFKVEVTVIPKVISDSPEGQVVSVSATVNPGSIYRLKNLTFTGATAFTTHELDAMFPIAPGDIMAGDKIRKGLNNLRSAYGAKGYKDYSCAPHTELEDSNHTIALRIEIAERSPSNSSSGERPLSAIDVLSDTKGVNFGPYLQSVLKTVKQNWYKEVAEDVTKTGNVSVEFAIQKDGEISGTQLSATSGDVALDRAALDGITASNPFAPLPSEFGGQYIALRFHFYYNPFSPGGSAHK
jgi:TonB family protein